MLVMDIQGGRRGEGRIGGEKINLLIMMVIGSPTILLLGVMYISLLIHHQSGHKLVLLPTLRHLKVPYAIGTDEPILNCISSKGFSWK